MIFFFISAFFYLLHDKYFPAEQAEKNYVPVVAVHDGDTVSVIINSKEEKVRLIGIDAPEISQRPWGKRSQEYLETVLSSSGWKVKLETDIEKKDKYGRILVYLWSDDDKMINLLMVKSGNAMLYTVPPNVKHVDEFISAQREAKDKRLGIWGEKGLKEKPSDYRRKHPIS
ncbi:MAG: thermonuclease family protein [Nitrospirota bacterium]